MSMELKDSIEIAFPEILKEPSMIVKAFIERVQTVIPEFDGYYVKAINAETAFRLEKYFIENECKYEIVGPIGDFHDYIVYHFYLLEDGSLQYVNPLLCGFWLWMTAMEDNYYKPRKQSERGFNEERLYVRWYSQLYKETPLTISH